MKDELFHSDIYLGKDFSDGIQHFKYIKREKKNGKWVYYYRDNEYEKDKMLGRMGDSHRKDLDKISGNVNMANKAADFALNKMISSQNNKKDHEFYTDQYKKALRNKQALHKLYSDKSNQYFKDSVKAAGKNMSVTRYNNTYEKGEQAVIKAHNNNKLIKAREKVAKGLVKSLNAVENAKAKGKSIFKKIFKK